MNSTYITELDEISMIAGNSFSLEFELVDDDGVPVDLSEATCKWELAPLGNLSKSILTKVGIVYGVNKNCYRVLLKPEDTESLNSKYVQQPVIIDRTGEVFRRAQGIIWIRPQIN